MKRAILLIGVILIGFSVRAQSLTYSCRYWYDHDDANVVSTEFTGSLWEEELDVGTLTNGLHTLHLQVMDTSMNWSAPENFLFLKLDVISTLEFQYWFDQDLEGKQVNSFSNALLLDVDALDLGLHTLHVMLKGTEYTSTESYLFLKADGGEQMESYTYHCWFDTDFDNRQVDLLGNGSLLLDVSNLTDGIHTLNVMLEGSTLTSTESYLFVKVPIEEGEGDFSYRYWFDRDFNNSQSIIMTEGLTLLDVSGLDIGLHSLHLMKEGSSNSSAESYLFVKLPVDNPDAGTQYHCWFDQDYNTLVTGPIGSGVFVVPVGMLTVGEHNMYMQLYDETLSSPEVYSFYRDPMVTIVSNPVDGGTAAGQLVDTICTLTAQPNQGFAFVNWTTVEGEVLSADPIYSFSLLEDATFVANFIRITYTITAEANPSVGGTVEGAGVYTYGSEVTLTATPNVGYHFLNWTKGATVVSNETTISFTALEDADYMANFELNSYQVHVMASPEEGGNVEGAGLYNHGVTVTLTATPNVGYHFLNWTDMGGEVVSSEQTYSFTVTDFAEFVANFELNSYEITAVANPEDGGTVEGSGIYNHGQTCTLEATPNEGYGFINWTKGNEVVSDEPTISFTVTESAEYQANFEVETYEISGNVSPHAGGTVEGFGYYAAGETCTLTAIPNEGYVFLYWRNFEGDIVSYDMVYSFTVTGDAMYYASFELSMFEVNAFADPEEGGTVEGAGFYAYGATCTLTATPYENFIFVNWTEEGEVVSASDSYTFEVTGNRTLVANFEYVSPLETDYITDGMILYLDGILNTRDGHSTTTEVWEDLIGNNDVTVNGYSSYTWEDNHFIGLGREGYLNTGKTWQYFNSLNGDLTIEIVTYIDCDKTWPEYRGLIGWHVNSDGMHAQNDQGSNRMQTLGILPVEAADDQIATVTYTRFEGSYLNGVWGAELNSMPDGVNSSKIAVFGNSFSQWRGWNDSIYCIRMYNRTLTPEEIAYNHSVDIERFGAGFPTMYYVFANANPDEGGTVEGFGDYAAGSTCTLIATSNEGYEFLYWVDNEGEVVSYDMEYSFTVTGDAYYYAVFELGMYEILAFANPEDGGTVEGGGSFAYGETCTLTAIPNEGYSFLYWLMNGDVVSTEPEYSFEVYEYAELIAVFESSAEIFYIEAFANPEEGGSVSGSSYYFLNDYCTLLAVANDGYVFVNWTKDGEVVSTEPEYVFEVLEAGNYVANFELTSAMQATNLSQGWNWWSTYVEANDLLEQLENGLDTHGQTIKSQSGYVQYMPGYNVWYGSTGFAVNNESFYMVQTNADCDVEIGGSLANPEEHPITLASGWNWIGYPCSTHQSFVTAFAGITPQDGDVVKSQSHGFASYMADYSIWYGTLADYGIDPGMGLMYKSNNNQPFSFTYPQGRGEEPVGSDFTENNYWNANYNAYPNNMTVTAVVELDDVELGSENYELAAFANGECRGSVRLMHVAPLNRYMAFLTVAGDEASELRFSLYDVETGTVETECLTTLPYETNAIIGSFESPYVVRFRSTTGVDELGSRINIFPNPISRNEMLNLTLPAETLGKAHVEIVNAIGQVVEAMDVLSVQRIKAPDASGVYTLRITVDGEGTYCRKLVVR